MKIAIKILIAFFLLTFIALYIYRYRSEENYQALRISVLCRVNFGKQNVDLCFSEKFEDLAFQKGWNLAMKTLRQMNIYNKDIVRCHDLAHSIGKGLYRKDRDSVGNILNNASSECDFGVAHGMIESYLASNSQELDKNSIKNICGNDEAVHCNHIVGHFLLVWTDKNVAKALNLCESLGEKKQVYICEVGVFMEYITGQNLLTHGLISASWFKEEASLEKSTEMCNSYKDLSKIACWETLPHAIVPRLNRDLRASYSYCELALNRDATDRCKNLATALITGKGLGFGMMFLLNN